MTDVLTLQSIHHTFEKGTINENHVLRKTTFDCLSATRNVQTK